MKNNRKTKIETITQTKGRKGKGVSIVQSGRSTGSMTNRKRKRERERGERESRFRTEKRKSMGEQHIGQLGGLH